MSFLPFKFDASYYYDDNGPEIKFKDVVFTADCGDVSANDSYGFAILNLGSGELELYDDRFDLENGYIKRSVMFGALVCDRVVEYE